MLENIIALLLDIRHFSNLLKGTQLYEKEHLAEAQPWLRFLYRTI